MRLSRLWFGGGHPPHMFGDCDECGHSAIYHVPIVGCMKCDCGEFH